MVLQREKMLQEIKELLIQVESWIAADKQIRHQNSFIEIENFYREVLNFTFGWKLKNANDGVQKNQEAFDLHDETSGVAVQVTVDTRAAKIRSTLESFVGKYDKTYPRLVFAYPVMDAKKTRADFSEVEGELAFDAKNDCIWFGTVLKEVQAWSAERQCRFAELLSQEVVPVGEVVGEKGRRLGQRSVAYVDSRTEERSERFEEFSSAYRKAVAARFNRIRLIGVPEMRDVRQDFNAAYMSLRIVSSRKEKSFGENQSAEEVLLQEPYVTIRGPAGSGKTTLLQWIASSCSNSGSKWWGAMPFYIPLRKIPSGKPDFRKFLEYSLSDVSLLPAVPGNWEFQALEEGNAIVLIDGVDEISRSARRSFWDWLDKFLYLHKAKGVFITSRRFAVGEDGTAADWAPPSRFLETELQELDDREMRVFIEKWHDAVLAEQTDLEDVRELEIARGELPAKLVESRNSPVIELCRNPLLCSLICALHWRQEGYLPDRRVDLYERCCDMLLDARDRKRGVVVSDYSKLRGEEKELILQRLALSMMRNAGGVNEMQIEASKTDVEHWINAHMQSLDLKSKRMCKASTLLKYLIERTGLLREPVFDRIEFAHRTFQEYLAACAAGALNDLGDLVARAGDDQWRETILMAAGTKVGGVPFGNSLIGKLLEVGASETRRLDRAVYFSLALGCVQVAKQPSPELQERARSEIEALLPPQCDAEAKVLAVAGDGLLEFLDYSKWRHKKVGSLKPVIQLIGLIGTGRAFHLLEDDYGRDSRVTLIKEICELPSVNPLAVKTIRDGMFGTMNRQLSGYVRGVKDIEPLKRFSKFDWEKFERATDFGSVGDAVEGLLLVEDLAVNNEPRLRSVAAIAKLARLRTLSLVGCRKICDMHLLASCKKLEALDISKSTVTDLSFTSSCVQLTNLDVSRSSIRSLKGIATHLVSLNISDCSIEDYTELLEIKKLKNLVVSNGQVAKVPLQLNKIVTVQERG
jgi:hypothetical protein